MSSRYRSIVDQGSSPMVFTVSNAGGVDEGSITYSQALASESRTTFWGDGTTDTTSGNVTVTHTYPSAGTYIIETSGDVGKVRMTDIAGITSFNKFGGDAKLSNDQESVFESANYPEVGGPAMSISAQVGYPKFVANTTTKNYFFNTKLTVTDWNNLDLNSWPQKYTGRIIEATQMFTNADNFNQDLDNWDMGNCLVFTSFFKDCTDFNGNVSQWDMSGATSINGMFYTATSFDQDLSAWDVSNCGIFAGAFRKATAFGSGSNTNSLTNWDMSNATRISSMFADSAFNGSISGWTISPTTTQDCFKNNTAFNQDLSGWDITSLDPSSYNSARGMFDDCTTMSGENYSKTLIGWANQVSSNAGAPIDCELGAANVTYNNTTYTGSPYSDAVAARAYLTGTAGWTITDGGVA